MPLTTVNQVVAELFDSDEHVKKQFQEHVSAQVIEFAQDFSALFATYENFAKDCSGNGQAALVAGLMHGVLDDALTSGKLLLSGKLNPSGNLIRQATEGLCMAIMCAQTGTLSIGDREQSYWNLVLADDKAVEGNLAPRQLLKNIDRLGLTAGGVKQLALSVGNHHRHSHAGGLAMAHRMDLGPAGKIHYGGHFDPEKIDGYRAELAQLVSVAKWARETLLNLWPQIKALSKDVP